MSKRIPDSSPLLRDDLLQFARIASTLFAEIDQNPGQVEWLADRLGVTEDQLHVLVDRAERIHVEAARLTQAGDEPRDVVSSLQRSDHTPDGYDLVGPAAWIAVEDPDHEGCGYDVRLRKFEGGVRLAVYPLSDIDDSHLNPLLEEDYAFSDIEYDD